MSYLEGRGLTPETIRGRPPRMDARGDAADLGRSSILASVRDRHPLVRWRPALSGQDPPARGEEAEVRPSVRGPPGPLSRPRGDPARHAADRRPRGNSTPCYSVKSWPTWRASLPSGSASSRPEGSTLLAMLRCPSWFHRASMPMRPGTRPPRSGPPERSASGPRPARTGPMARCRHRPARWFKTLDSMPSTWRMGAILEFDGGLPGKPSGWPARCRSGPGRRSHRRRMTNDSRFSEEHSMDVFTPRDHSLFDRPPAPARGRSFLAAHAR